MVYDNCIHNNILLSFFLNVFPYVIQVLHYDDNYEKLKLSLSTIDAELKSMVENAKDKNIIVASNDLKILSKYGLEITSIDETNMTDKDLADAKALLNNKTVTYIFTKKGENESNTLKELLNFFHLQV